MFGVLLESQSFCFSGPCRQLSLKTIYSDDPTCHLEFTYGQSVPSLKLPKPSSFHYYFYYCFDKCLLHFNFHLPIHNPLSIREAAGTSMLLCFSIKIRVDFGENDQGALTLLNLKSL